MKHFLQQHLTEVEQSNILEETDKTELYSMYINCLEVWMLFNFNFKIYRIHCITTINSYIHCKSILFYKGVQLCSFPPILFLQDSMFERMQFCSGAEQNAYLQEETVFLSYYTRACPDSATVQHLQQVARVRMDLDMAATLLVQQLDGV